MKLYTLDAIKDEFIGVHGTANRDRYEKELKLELLNKVVKKIDIKANLTK